MRIAYLAVTCAFLASCNCNDSNTTGNVDERVSDPSQCTGNTVFCYETDGDGDGFAVDGTAGFCRLPQVADCISEGGDCDDADEDIRPGASEVADGVDNDCDGQVDEGLVAPTERTDIYWGDTHVHTRFSFDAFVTMSRTENAELGYRGELVFARDVSEACDFGHYCSQIDFMATTEHAENVPEDLWNIITDQVRTCDASYGPSVSSPDGLNPLHVYAGWEWTQGNPAAQDGPNAENNTSFTQYGHKNVIYPSLAEEDLPIRVVSAAVLAPATDQLCDVARLCGTPLGSEPTFQCPQALREGDIGAAQAFNSLSAECADGIPPKGDPRFEPDGECFGACTFFIDTGDCEPAQCVYPDCDLDAGEAAQVPNVCPQYAYTAGGLFGLLDSWSDPGRFGLPKPIVGAHGTAWYNGGHGNWDADYPTPDTKLPDPGNFQQHDPELQTFIEVYSKHGSGELYPSRVAVFEENQACYDGRGVECFHPASSSDEQDDIRYVNQGTAQYALSQQRSGPDGDFALNLGLLAAMDTHHARPGSTIEDPRFGEWESTEVFCGIAGIEPEDCPFQYAYAGGLAAVHAPLAGSDAVRTTLFEGLQDRNVYGTSGPRIELWFYMTNPPTSADCIEDGSGECPMGSVLPNVPTADGSDPFVPSFRAHAKGSPQFSTDCSGQPAPPKWEGGADAFHEEVCRDQCYHETSEADADRTRIEYFEVIRVLRGWLGTDGSEDYTDFTVNPDQDDPAFGFGDETVINTVDTIRVPCAGAEGGAQDCWADFEDPQWQAIVDNGGNAVYYVRAIQEETTAYNGTTGTDDEEGCTVDGVANFEGEGKVDCYGPTNERAWSSPIFLFSGDVAAELP